MTKTTTITINGRLYDAITGMPVVNAAPATTAARRQALQTPPRQMSDIAPRPDQPDSGLSTPTPPSTPKPPAMTDMVARGVPPSAANIHAHHTQKSTTLYRKSVKRPQAAAEVNFSPTRSPIISHYGSNVTHHPKLTAAAQQADEKIAPPLTHPAIAKVATHSASHHDARSSQELKEQLIRERLAQVDNHTATPVARRWFQHKPRLASILASTLALLVLGGYMTYMNLPMISMKVAASRAGVNATLPGYKPDGYSLDGPITYSPGQVNVNYKSNTNDSTFRLTQAPSSWDSQGVLDNFVVQQTETYLTFQERGIKIYTFDNKAAWVNGGLLYTIEGTAALSSDQVLRLATSM